MPARLLRRGQIFGQKSGVLVAVFPGPCPGTAWRPSSSAWFRTLVLSPHGFVLRRGQHYHSFGLGIRSCLWRAQCLLNFPMVFQGRFQIFEEMTPDDQCACCTPPRLLEIGPKLAITLKPCMAGDRGGLATAMVFRSGPSPRFRCLSEIWPRARPDFQKSGFLGLLGARHAVARQGVVLWSFGAALG